MSTNHDWLVKDRAGQLSLAKSWILAMTQNQTKWGIPANVLSDLVAAIAAASTALDTAKNEATRTPVATISGAYNLYLSARTKGTMPLL